LRPSRKVTQANVCRGFDTTALRYEDLFDFLKAGLRKDKM
jgi:hypothetical protein